MPKHVLLTGASGTLGRVLAARLGAAGYRLRLSDITPFPDPLPEGAEFIAAELRDRQAVADLVKDTDIVLHFGGLNGEKPFDQIIDINIIGVTHIFEAVRARRQRVVFASSNHTIGYHPYGKKLTVADEMRPDSYYGLSKCYGELLGVMALDKHGIESVHLRIGSCVPVPLEARHQSTWLSYDDLERLAIASIEALETGCAIVWGVSANTDSWWSGDDAERIGYRPEDNAAHFAPLPEVGDAIMQRFQGGPMTSMDYTRDRQAGDDTAA